MCIAWSWWMLMNKKISIQLRNWKENQSWSKQINSIWIQLIPDWKQKVKLELVDCFILFSFFVFLLWWRWWWWWWKEIIMWSWIYYHFGWMDRLNGLKRLNWMDGLWMDCAIFLGDLFYFKVFIIIMVIMIICTMLKRW